MIIDRATARDVTSEDIRALIEHRVTEQNDLKFKAEAERDLLKTACGVANYGGGFILWGIRSY